MVPVQSCSVKAAWYLDHGVAIVWTVVPETRRVHVTAATETIEVTERLPESPLLPGLAPLVASFFCQL